MKSLWIVAALAAVLSVNAQAAQDSPKNDAQIESELKAARERLEQAAQEVAELSSKLSGPVMDRLMVFGRTAPAIIGMMLENSGGKEGARVVDVSPGGPAAEAGIKAGDLVVSVNGTKLEGENSAQEFVKRMRDVEPDSKVKLRVMREGKPKDFELTARAPKGMFARAMPAMPALPEPPPGMAVTMPFNNFSFALNDEIAGMELATITPELGRYFGTDKGVLVVRAPDRTSFKLQDGDVIMAIGGREPKNGSHATRILRSYQPGEKIELKVMRQHKTTNLEVELPEDVRRTRMMGFDPPERGTIEIFHHTDVETL